MVDNNATMYKHIREYLGILDDNEYEVVSMLITKYMQDDAEPTIEGLSDWADTYCKENQFINWCIATLPHEVAFPVLLDVMADTRNESYDNAPTCVFPECELKCRTHDNGWYRTCSFEHEYSLLNRGKRGVVIAPICTVCRNIMHRNDDIMYHYILPECSVVYHYVSYSHYASYSCKTQHITVKSAKKT